MVEIISFLKKILQEGVEPSLSIIMRDKQYTSVDARFVPFSSSLLSDMIFVDGGQGIVFDTSLFCVAKLRIVACFFNSLGKNVWNKEFCCYALCHFDDSGRLFCSFDILHNDFSFSLPDFSFAVDDEFLVSKGKTATPLTLVGVVRRYIELCVCKEMGDLDYIVCLDGSLRPQIELEKKIIEQMSKKVCAFTKTQNFITQGHGVRLLDSVGYMHIGYSPSLPDIYLVCMHHASRYTFSLETFSEITSIFSCLLPHCLDPRFFGYPYGLIKADRLARISHVEIEQERVRLKMRLKDLWPDIEPILHTKDAHDILDNIS